MVGNVKANFTLYLSLYLVHLEATSNITTNILKFIKQAKQEKPYETLVFYINKNSVSYRSWLFEELLAGVQPEAVVLINRETSYEYREKFNSEILLVRWFFLSDDYELFDEFQSFPVRTNFRVLFIFANDSNAAALKIFEQYCSSTQNHQIINMLAITSDISTTKTYLRCRHLDAFQVELKQYTESTLLYEDRLRDMGGSQIRTLEDLLEPRTMLDYDEHGNRKLSGYVGKLMRAFVHKHNATLKSIFEITANETVFYKDIQNITHAGLLDIGATLIVPINIENLNDLTYPYELSKYCLMIPLPPDIPLQQIFSHILRPSIIVALIALMLIFGFLLTYTMHDGRLDLRSVLLNDRSLRGLLGQSFPMPHRYPHHLKCILVLIFFTSVMVNCMYLAYLQAFLTHPPTEAPLLTLDDISAARKIILVAHEELFIFRSIPELQMDKLGHLFEITDTFHEFTKRRSRLDINYVYPASLARWLVFNEQQKLFARKMFFYQKDLCMVPFMLLHLPILKNSRYRDAIERVMLQIRDSGLMKKWMSFNFYDMIRLHRTSLEDLSTPNEYGIALELHDFYWIWCMYLVGISLSSLWFCWELLRWRCRKQQR